MRVLDTNYLIRFLTQDIEEQARQAKQVIVGEQIYLPAIVLAETVYILENHYQVKKQEVCQALKGFLMQENVRSVEHGQLALEIYEQEKISFYDSLIVAESATKKWEVASFDQELVEVWRNYKIKNNHV